MKDSVIVTLLCHLLLFSLYCKDVTKAAAHSVFIKQFWNYGSEDSGIISFGIWMIWFLSGIYWSSLHHDLMTSIWEKAISIFAGNLNSSRSYLITAVLGHFLSSFFFALLLLVCNKNSGKKAIMYKKRKLFGPGTSQDPRDKIIIFFGTLLHFFPNFFCCCIQRVEEEKKKEREREWPSTAVIR